MLLNSVPCDKRSVALCKTPCATIMYSASKSCLLISADPMDHVAFVRALADVAPNSHFILAESAVAALDFLKGDCITPDCVFMELDMIGIDGIDFLRLSKHSAQLQNVPIIIHSPRPAPEKVSILREMGAFAIYFQPYSHLSIRNVFDIFFKDDFRMCFN